MQQLIPRTRSWTRAQDTAGTPEAEIRCPEPIPHHITSHHITSHHIKSHRVTSHNIRSHHITSHHITSHHITLHHITSHHITSHHVTSRHTARLTGGSIPRPEASSTTASGLYRTAAASFTAAGRLEGRPVIESAAPPKCRTFVYAIRVFQASNTHTKISNSHKKHTLHRHIQLTANARTGTHIKPRLLHTTIVSRR